MTIYRRTLLRGVAGGSLGMLAGPHLAQAAAAAARPAEPARDIGYRAWSGRAGFAAGTSAGTAWRGQTLTVHTPIGRTTYSDPFTGVSRDYEYATWTSPWVRPGFAASQAVASWNADTPSGTWLQTELRGITATGATTKWYVMGRWAADDAAFSRTSVPGQGDANGTVDIDTFEAADGAGLVRWQLRGTLYRLAGTTRTPALRSIGAMASLLPEPADYPTSTARFARGTVLPVPRYSQDVHVDQYPQWDNGGEAWCSPTSTSMVVAYWGKGPRPADYGWVDPSYADPWVDYAARNTYDNNYSGCGNWPFNTAYAARFGLAACVTRLRSFQEVERFIAEGVPVIVSAAFAKGQVPGADYSTNGHLMVIAGFTEHGDPVMNDPAAPDDAAVRKVFGRPEFETAWRNSSGGTAYLIHPPDKRLPAPPAQANW
ncbi:peptidase C39 family protein [Rugosimonospora acidiphila]|uniref:Peptidase C39 family protein n=1 Tax=Rugosimonospora acidiphila TaxID=556531 RepID=A0ABP9S740_9ACTN